MGCRKRRQVTKKYKLNSFLFSLAFHVIVLTTLALSIQTPHKKNKPIQISVELNQVSDIEFINEPINISDHISDIEYVSIDNVDIPDIDCVDNIINVDMPEFKFEQVEKRESPSGISKGSSVDNAKPSGGANKISKDVKEFKKRLSKYKARSGDIQVSLIWDNHNDIDLHVKYISGYTNNKISWTNKSDSFGGLLDVDMNSVTSYRSDHPVENIFWPSGKAPRGIFKVYVHHYTCTGKDLKTPVKIMIKTNDDIKVINTFAVFGDNLKEVYSFTTK
jgi:hypothetical protein